MNIVSLAWRNVFRNRRRSVATLLAMTIGLSAVLVFGGYAANVTHGLETAVVKRSGHLEIQRKGYFLNGDENPETYGIVDYQEIIELVEHDPVLRPMLEVVTPSLEFGGIAENSSAGVSRTVAATGVNVADRNKMSLWNDYDVVNYAHPLALVGTSADSVIVGEGVARKLQLCGPLRIANCPQPMADTRNDVDAPADVARLSAQEKSSQGKASGRETRIELLAANTHGAPNVINVNVAAADNVGVKEWDDVYLVMHLREAQRLVYGSARPQVTAISVLLKHTSELDRARVRLHYLLRDRLGNGALEILDFETLNPMYRQSVSFMTSIFSFIAVLIGVIVLFTVGNTMSMAVTERTVEIGTLRAMGLRRAGLRSLFLCEGMLLGMIGAVLGIACSLAVAFAINRSGLTWTPPGHIYAYLIQVSILDDLKLMFGCAAGLVFVTAVSAWWPAGRASRMHVVDALRHV